MRVKELKNVLEGCIIIGPEDIEVSEITCDSRAVLDDKCLFAAVPGVEADGYSFISDALDNGASSVLTPRRWKGDGGGRTITEIIVPEVREALGRASASIYGEPSEGLTLVGVTGTNGKTTVTYMLDSIFSACGFETGLIGTVSYRFGSKIVPAPRTTPDAPTLQRLLRDMREAGVTHCAMEVSSHGLDQKRVGGCGFDAAVFTNLTHEHMDYHRSEEDYFKAKSYLFTLLKKGGFPVINIDDPWGRRLAGTLSEPVTTGLTKEALIHPRGATVTEDGIEALVETPAGPVSVSTTVTGGFNLSNILCAIGVAFGLGIERGQMERGLREFKGVPGRVERIKVEGRELPYSAYVDYAHTPDAIVRLLGAAREIGRGRIILVFGCGGDRDRTKRAEMGEAAARGADIIIITSDNPRNEDPMAIISDITVGLKHVKYYEAGKLTDIPGGKKAYTVIADRGEAIREAVAMARRGDTLLLAGKGHEDYQILGDKRLDFQDAIELRRAMRVSCD